MGTLDHQNMHNALDSTAPVPVDEIAELLEKVRVYLKMEIAFVSRFVNGGRQFRCVRDDGSGEVQDGASDPLEETYCARIADGRLPRVIKDSAEIAEASALAVTNRLRIRAYLSAPVVVDGAVWGTVCCISHNPRPDLLEGDAKRLDTVAGLVASKVLRRGASS